MDEELNSKATAVEGATFAIAKITNRLNDHLPVGLLAKLVGCCTAIAEFNVVRIPLQARMFFTSFPFFLSFFSQIE